MPISGIYTSSQAQQVWINNADPVNPFYMLAGIDVGCIANSVLAGVVVDVKWNDGSKNRIHRVSVPLVLLTDADSAVFPVELGPGQDLTIESVLSTGLGSPSFKLLATYNQTFPQ